LYSDEEIGRLLRAALAWKCRCSYDALKPYTFHCLSYIPHLSSRFNSQFPLCRGAVG
jgi:hypothetical protein